MFAFSSWLYGSPSVLLFRLADGSFRRILSAQGVRQGCILASFLFSLSMKPYYSRAVSSRPVRSVAIVDDFHIFGATAHALASYDAYAADLDQSSSGISLHPTKKWAMWISPTGAPPPSDVVAQCEARGLAVVTSDCHELLGSYVGTSPAAISQALLDSSLDDTRRLCSGLLSMSSLFGSVQASSLLLRLCANAKPTFLCRTLPPSITADYTLHHDRLMLGAFLSLYTLPPTLSRAAIYHISMPLRLSGGGLRPMHRTRFAAYWGSAVSAVFHVNALVAPPTVPSSTSQPPPSPSARQPPSPSSSLEVLLDEDVSLGNASLHAPASSGSASPQDAARPPLIFSHLQTTYNVLTGIGLEAEDDSPYFFERSFPETLVRVCLRPVLSGIQSSLTKGLENILDDCFRASASRHDVARLLSTRTDVVNLATPWLLTPPSEAMLAMSARDCSRNMRHRLGLYPADAMPSHCLCGASLRDDPTHAHTCPLIRRKAVDKRHGLLLHTLAACAADAGVLAIVEDHTRRHEWPDTNLFFPPDITGSASGHVLCDVSVACPTASSHIANAINRAGSVANTRADAKVRRYADLAEEQGSTSIPFVAETYGALSKSASKLISYLVNAYSDLPSSPLTPDQFRTLTMQRLSVALAKGNSLVEAQGMQLAMRASAHRARHGPLSATQLAAALSRVAPQTSVLPPSWPEASDTIYSSTESNTSCDYPTRTSSSGYN